MAEVLLDAQTLTGELFCLVPDGELGQVLDVALELMRRNPAILTRIDADRDAAGLAKKVIRNADARWHAEQTARIPGLVLPEAAERPPLPLEQGRPRMPADLAYLFFVLQGYFGSVTDRRARERLQDSLTLQVYLRNRGLRMPSWQTILDNVNAISVQTRSVMMDAQLAMIRQDELDDFSQAIVDSTAARANSAWPTDGRILVGLLSRAYRASQKLEDFGLANLPSHWVPRWLRKARGFVFRINVVGGKQGANRKRKKYYRPLLQTTEKLLDHLLPQVFDRDPLSEVSLPPSQQALLAGLWGGIQDDLVNACSVYDYTEKRIFQDLTRPARDKVLSLGDPSAAIIQKSDRPAVIGYKPELSRSANGFVTALIVEEGNVNDAMQLVPVVDQIEARTGVRPTQVTADDGYAVAAIRDELLASGVDKVYLCGSKAKAFTAEEDWESEVHLAARRGRSAVESLMSVLKSLFGFGWLRRRGLEAVRAELLSKVVAYNFYRVALLRARDQAASRNAA